jgi:hypothetical protein
VEELFGEVVRLLSHNFLIDDFSGEGTREMEVENVIQGLR